MISDVGGRLDTHPGYLTPSGTELEDGRDSLSAAGPVGAFPCDVRRPGDVQALIDETVARFGRLDVLVNNAGVAVGLQPVIDLTEEDWALNLNVMATGVFLCSRAAARQMISQGDGGRIITIGSQSSKTGFPLMAAYCAAKFAALGFTQALAQELAAEGITVNVVCPGMVDTPMLSLPGGMFEAYGARYGITAERYRERIVRQIPVGRFADPAEVAAVVGFLASPAAAYITGEAINVTGGMEMH